MRDKSEIRRKLKALQDLGNSKEAEDVVNRALIAGEIEALEWVLGKNRDNSSHK